MKRFLSLGAGVQSSTLALMCAKGEIPAPDAAIFSDTGWEPKAVYKWLDWLEKQLPFPVYRVSKGNLRDDTLAGINSRGKRFAAIPWHMEEGMGKRQCTMDYKIAPLRQKMRELIGPHSKNNKCEVLIGISRDEAMRAKPSRNTWQLHTFPLLDLGMSRGDCLAWMYRNGYPEPPKSSCLGCPYHSDAQWKEIKSVPEEWADVVAVDRIIRVQPKFNKLQYMHRSLMPIDEAPFNDDSQLNLFGNECEGMCGV
jgi:hypothetical protein